MNVLTDIIDRSRGCGVRMEDKFDFQYCSPNGIKLDTVEGKILEEVDKLEYSLLPYSSLGELHKELEVELRDKTKERFRTVVYKKKDVEKLLEEIKKKLEKNREDQSLYNLYEGILREMKEKGVDELEKKESMTVLGEYIRKEEEGRKVVLYMDTIREIGKTCTPWLLAEVYVHEMHHAWFDYDSSEDTKDNYIKEIEEPITELGMLLFMEKFDLDESGILNYALYNVKKKKAGMASCYGFGSYLYEDPRKLNWRDAYYNAKYQIKFISSIATGLIIKKYCSCFQKGLYPIDEKQWATHLWRILHDAMKTVAGPFPLPAHAISKKYLFSKEVVKTTYSFGIHIDAEFENLVFDAIGKRFSIGDKKCVTIFIDGVPYEARLEVLQIKNHLNPTTRMVWLNKNELKRVKAGMEIEVYHLGGNVFEIINK